MPAKREQRAAAPRPLPGWRVVASRDERLFARLVRAATKSEARALLKRQFGLGRLPARTRLERR